MLKGQIARYMKAYKRKYAFLTTYEETMFLKQEEQENGEWVLWYSEPIFHHVNSNFNIANPDDHRQYRGCVSLRECFLYFHHISGSDSTDYMADNPTDSKLWTDTTRGKKLYGSKSQGKHIVDNSEESIV